MGSCYSTNNRSPYDRIVDCREIIRENVADNQNQINLWIAEAIAQCINPQTKVTDKSRDSDPIRNDSGYCRKQVAPGAISQDDGRQVRLFECLFLVSIDSDVHNEQVPCIKLKYPRDVDVPQSIVHMCFPDAHNWCNGSSEKTSDQDLDGDRRYVITLTNEAGLRKYAYCSRIKPQGESYLLPLSYCILSGHKANEFYFSILEEVERRHSESIIEYPAIKNPSQYYFILFIAKLHETIFPLKGEKIRIPASFARKMKDKKRDDVVLMRPSDTKFEDLRLAKAFAYLKMKTFLMIFSSLLLERRVILLSNSIGKLSTCIEGLLVALLPFTWQHTLITAVPSKVISVPNLCAAPTPYLIGLLKSPDIMGVLSDLKDDKIQVLAVDLDEGEALCEVGDENSFLMPNNLAARIKYILHLAHPHLFEPQIYASY